MPDARHMLRSAPLVLLALSMLASPAAAQQTVGVNSAVNPNATGTPPGGTSRRLVIGAGAFYNERIETQAGGQTQILFLDESSLSVGPNSDVVIDQFVYDPKTGKGKMFLSATRGILRFVGGRLSKIDEAVTMRTPVATMGIRGGIFLMKQVPNGPLEAVLVYGPGLTVTGTNGVSRTITRPGFAVTVAGPGASPSPPAAAARGTLAGLLSQVDGRAGGTGGASTIPTEAIVANSGVAAAISGNLPASLQAAAQNQPPPAQPRAFNVAAAQTSLQVGTVQNQGSSIIQSADANPTPPGTPIPTQGQTTPPTTVPVTPAAPTTVTITYAGLAKSTNGPRTAAGYDDQSANGRIPYSDGTLTYASNAMQDGTFAASIGALGAATLGPLTPGSTNAVTAQTALGPLIGTATMTADGTFFYANLTPTNPALSNQSEFIFGGIPVNQSFYAGNLPAQITAFQLQPDAALASGSQPQTIPFLPSDFGGTMPNASVSDLYLATGANSPFGTATTTNGLVAPKFLQASLAINGQGASQTSALVVSTGDFFTYPGNGTVVASGPVRGTVMTSATSPTVIIASGVATVPDGNGNSLFGGNTLSGFVLDQNSYNFNDTFSSQLATATPRDQNTTSYAFNQPATGTPLPATVPGTRQALNESGYFGGIMERPITATTTSPYVLTGLVNPLQSVPTNNRVAATFTGSDPFTPSQSGIRSIVLNFGSVTPETNGTRGTYINNNIFATTESTTSASSIDGNPLALPQNGTTAAPSPLLALVTSGTVPNTTLLPAGVSYCSCQYLQWGYWTGQVQSTPTQGLMSTNEITERADINTWLAGTPTAAGDLSTLASMGATGAYSGAAVGTVFNNGATYLAAGGFSQAYNFGTQAGSIAITNFDGRSFGATLHGTNSTDSFSGTLTGTSLTGSAAGAFYGPSAIETGGNFAVQSTAGPAYLASGIFAGRQIGR